MRTYVSASIHVKPDTELSFHSYPQDGRVTVQLGESPGAVTLFLPRAEIDRLAGVLAEAREALSASGVKEAA
ncbi:hypothetical protein ACGF7U_08415 [Micromonospora sp. NPDC047670]|uniref:hypothetical protein n=1 Tax=Micromonospora sp. NPDC047670 TaxID=3364252 RepID=UPI00370F848C